MILQASIECGSINEAMQHLDVIKEQIKAHCFKNKIDKAGPPPENVSLADQNHYGYHLATMEP